MNVIFFSKREGLARQLNLAHPVTLGILAVLVLGILGTAFALGMQLGQGSSGRLASGESARWTQILADQGADVIMVEAEGGDTNRVMGPGPHPERLSEDTAPRCSGSHGARAARAP